MATNSGRGNPIPASEGPAQTTPPPVSTDLKSEVQAAAAKDAPGVHESGQDAGVAPSEPPKVKTVKELEKERAKAAKLAKFAAKQAQKTEAWTEEQPSKAKEKKAKAEKKAEEEVVPPYVEDTPKGEKKRIKPFDHPNFKAYDPAAVESAWYDWWEKEGFFEPEFTPEGDIKEKGKFVIVHPPPNVTGSLHMGHGLGDSIQDCMIRWNRMRGRTTLWLPGCDHAGIATQSVVETMLMRRQGKTRHDLGREQFVDLIWEWKDEYHKKINNALRRLGGSFDWGREAFTMDETLSAAVVDTFVTLFDDGLIYRGTRLTSWCTALSTALSNVEVTQKELAGRTLLDVPGYDKKVEFGIIVHFKYQIEGSEETIEVATTRPETMLGDTGIAVHPEDKRWSHLIGKHAVHPFIEGRRLRIVGDDEFVEMGFGTGAVKITPAHDENDYKMGKKHGLEFINVFTDDGLLNENSGPFQGHKRFDVRYTVQEELKEKGLFVDKKDNPMVVPLCERTKDPIEPLIKPQWYMTMKPLAEKAMEAVRAGEIKIRPESAEKTFFRWMENIIDWCLSRQLVWGHRIACYYALVEGEGGYDTNPKRWFAGRTEEEAREKASKALGGENFTLQRDEDVLDTWFSSGHWPFSTLGWPSKTADLEKFFPTSVLETGWDIIPYWVCRMIMLSLRMTGKVPFKEVFCHGLVRDSDGRKMSKSLGNVIDPIDVIEGVPLEELHTKLRTGNLNPAEVDRAIKWQKAAFPNGIPPCGTDALRFWSTMNTNASDINLDVNHLHAFRKFCNKIFQATKYVMTKLPENFMPAESGATTPGMTLAEKWILHKMNAAAKDISDYLEAREFSKASMVAYQYWYNNLCDVYIENSKSIIQDGSEEERNSAIQTLYTALDAALRLIHPFMPFISEELWQRLPRRPNEKAKSIMVCEYPEYQATLDDAKSEAAYERVLGSARGARSLMAEYGLKEKVKIILQAYDAAALETITEQTPSIKTLCGKGVAEVDVLGPDASRPTGCVTFPVSSSLAVFLHVKGRVDMDAEIQKATRRLYKVRGVLDRQKKATTDAKYLEKVAQIVKEADLQRIADMESEVRGFEGTIKQFEQLKLE